MSRSSVELIEHESPRYILLQPGKYSPRSGPSFRRICTYRDVESVVSSFSNSQILAVDFETVGGDYSSGHIGIVGMGLSWDTGSCYFHWEDLHKRTRDDLLLTVSHHEGLIAHNVYFDGGVFLSNKTPANWHACTYNLLALLNNESPEFSWSLKTCMTDLLGWSGSNETELDEWLITNQHYKGTRLKTTDPSHLLDKYRNGNLKPDKSKMHLAPKNILGKYCCLDAEACYLLYTQVLYPPLQKFPRLWDFHSKQFLPLILRLIEQKIRGIEVDRDGLEELRNNLLGDIANYDSQFMNHELTHNHIQKITEDLLSSLRVSEPPRLKKNGEISKNWEKWSSKMDSAIRGEIPKFSFNINSGPQMRALLYDYMGFPVRINTEKGEAAVGVKSYKHMGEIGKLLIDRAYAVKRLSYVDKYLELTMSRNTIHPSFRTPGTVTGRLSGKDPNIQQIEKSQEMMSKFRSRAGYVWVDIDFAALESVVAAELSQDPNLLALYGDDAPENDIHLFIASQVPGEMSRKILATGYNPHNPPPGSVSRAKKECKRERNIAKTVVYACQFGAGVNKVQQTLENDDVSLDLEEVEAIHSTYWNTFSVLKQFSRQLYHEWRANRGYILNGLRRPMAVPGEYNKDLLNRCIQSTGHDILILYVNILIQLLDKSGVEWYPVILDLHDATTVEVPEESANQVVEIFLQAMDELNVQLGGIIRLRGKPTVGRTLSDCKEPEE